MTLVASDRADLIELTRSLIRIPSVYRPSSDPPQTELAVAELVREFAVSIGAVVDWSEPAPRRPVVIATIDLGSPGRTLLYEAHTDTVTEGDHSQWDHDPFSGDLDGDWIHGRGAIDTKGNVAAALIAARALCRSPQGLAGRIVLCFPCDEEDQMIGIKAFVAAGGADGIDAAIICEPEENRVCTMQKGAMRWRIDVNGKMAHGAMPREGANPIPALAAALAELQAMDQEVARLHGRHPFLGWPSVTPTIVRAPAAGEPQVNVVPASAWVGIDVRTIPGQDHRDLNDQARARLDAVPTEPEVTMRLNVVEDRPWTQTPADAAIVLAAKDAVAEVTRAAALVDGVPGTTDGTYLHLAGVPIVTIGAGNREMPHQANERVSCTELLVTAQIYEAIGRRFLGTAHD